VVRGKVNFVELALGMENQ